MAYSSFVSANLAICSNYTYCIKLVIPKYQVNDILYRKDLAKKGIIEKIKIKEVLLNPSYLPIIPIYRDNYNTLNPESDLCSLEEASELYYEYLENIQLQKDLKYLSKFKCFQS